MSETTALTVQMSLQDTLTLGKVLAESKRFSDATNPQQAVVKVMAGQELGFGPIASMTGIHIIKGRVTLSANLIGAAVKRSEYYTYKVEALDKTVCTISFYERPARTEDGRKIGTSTFTIEDAKQAGLVTGDNWKKYPRNMLFARALSNGAKWYCPDIFGGPVYTPDELGAIVDGDTGEVIDITPEPEPCLINENGLTNEEIIAKNRALLIGRIHTLNAQLAEPDVIDPTWLLEGATETELTGYGKLLRQRVDEETE